MYEIDKVKPGSIVRFQRHVYLVISIERDESTLLCRLLCDNLQLCSSFKEELSRQLYWGNWELIT